VRFVRITITSIPSGYDWPGMADVKVFGAAGENLTAGQPASADCFQPNTNVVAGIDVNFATAWTIDDRSKNHWLKVDLGKATDLAGCRILWEAPGFWYQYRVETSADDQHWIMVVDQDKNQKVAHQARHDFDARGVRYVRLTLTDCERGCWPGVRAFELMPSKDTPSR
jgi:hypothetical protein